MATHENTASAKETGAGKNETVIVVAHPDDEVLWFSSVLNEADKVVICFCDSEKSPSLGNARQKFLRNYCLQNKISLGIAQSDTFGGANWSEPRLTKYGIAISANNVSDLRYRRNYRILRESLKDVVSNAKTVYTHNPWGEYGSEDHIQLYKVLKSLSTEHHFALWFPNYVSEKTLPLMREFSGRIDKVFMLQQTNSDLAQKLKRQYQDSGCWTWFQDWQWLPQEAFLQEAVLSESTSSSQGPYFPLNMIVVNYKAPEKEAFWGRLRNNVGLWKRKLWKKVRYPDL